MRKSSAGRGGGKRISLYGIERLRALILDLAVRGKLVPQDAGDEPASKYLLTASQRVDPISAKGRRKQILPSSDESLELPSGWSATHLGSIVDIVRGITFPGSEKSKVPEFGRVACLRTANVQDQIEWDDILYIRDKFVSRTDQYIRQNDIIISMANSRELVGKVAIIEREPETPTAFGGFLAAIRAHSVDPRFLMAFLRCPMTKAQLIDDASQTTNIANISLSKLNPLPRSPPTPSRTTPHCGEGGWFNGAVRCVGAGECGRDGRASGVGGNSPRHVGEQRGRRRPRHQLGAAGTVFRHPLHHRSQHRCSQTNHPRPRRAR